MPSNLELSLKYLTSHRPKPLRKLIPKKRFKVLHRAADEIAAALDVDKEMALSLALYYTSVAVSMNFNADMRMNSYIATGLYMALEIPSGGGKTWISNRIHSNLHLYAIDEINKKRKHRKNLLLEKINKKKEHEITDNEKEELRENEELKISFNSDFTLAGAESRARRTEGYALISASEKKSFDVLLDEEQNTTSFVLDCFNGGYYSNVRVDAKRDYDDRIKGTVLAVAQNSIIDGLNRVSIKQQNGLAGRFLMYRQEDLTQDVDPHKQKTLLGKNFNALCRQLGKILLCRDGRSIQLHKTPCVTFSDESHKLLDYQSALFKNRAKRVEPLEQEALKKIELNIVKIATVLHVLLNSDDLSLIDVNGKGYRDSGKTLKTKVSKKTAKLATEITCLFFCNSMQYAHEAAFLGTSEDDELRKHIVSYFLNRPESYLSARDLVQVKWKCCTGKGATNKVKAQLNDLHKSGYLNRKDKKYYQTTDAFLKRYAKK